VQELGGLLNSSVDKSISDQRSRGVELRNMLYDIAQFGRQPVGKDTPHVDRMQMLKKILPHLPGTPGQFHMPEEAKSKEEALALLSLVQNSGHPLSTEGLVVHPPVGKPTKLKLFDEHGVFVRGVFPGKGKYEAPPAAGGFTYSFSPTGAVAGRVGAGLSDELRRDLMANASEYIGRLARVKAQDKLPSGSLRVPSLIGFHEDYPMAKTAGVKYTVAGKSPLDRLRQAKAYSDNRLYVEKAMLLRALMMEYPSDFAIDSESDGIFGITHKPTGFKVHLPSIEVPGNIQHLPVK